jgi:hypothetical protein
VTGCAKPGDDILLSGFLFDLSGPHFCPLSMVDQMTGGTQSTFPGVLAENIFSLRSGHGQVMLGSRQTFPDIQVAFKAERGIIVILNKKPFFYRCLMDAMTCKTDNLPLFSQSSTFECDHPG